MNADTSLLKLYSDTATDLYTTTSLYLGVPAKSPTIISRGVSLRRLICGSRWPSWQALIEQLVSVAFGRQTIKNGRE